MRDIVFIFVVIAFFAISAAYVGACARIIGREERRGSGTLEPKYSAP
jgi:hypothetical protein